jgi:phosphoadenosine phosphosulfate reductase
MPVFLSPPADIRLCSDEGRRLLKDLFETNYGNSDFLDGRIILLNKIAGIDRRDQVIVNGDHIATLSFDITTNTYRLDLELAGAAQLSQKAGRRILTCNKKLCEGHIKGKWLESRQIQSLSSGLIEGDNVILEIGEQVGVGIVRRRIDGSTAIRVKAIGQRNKLNPRTSTIDTVVRANLAHLRKLEKSAIRELRDYFIKTKQPVNVSFSGGKDSLASLWLTLKIDPNAELLFINTGLEFPETVEYVNRFCSERRLKLHIIQEENNFFEQLHHFGPPAKDFRWCCKTNKLGPLTTFIQKNYPRGCVTVEGRRIYESFNRARIGAIEKNPYVPNQTTLCPIRNWTALEVILYIHWNELPLNPLYEKDYERIGCWLCPASLQSEFANTKRTHPQLYDQWTSYLENWTRDVGLEPRYVEWGFWRWRKHPPKVSEIARIHGISLKAEQPREKKDIKLDVVRGRSPCGLKYSIEANIDVPQNYSFLTVAKALIMLGEVKYSDDMGVAKVTTKNGVCTLFANGHMLIIAPKGKAEKILRKIVETILRVQMCTKCGICEKSCPQGALRINETLEIDDKRCNQCGKCARGCIISNQASKMVPMAVASKA